MVKIKLNKLEFIYLLNREKITLNDVVTNKIILEIDEDIAIDMHDWVQDELQVSGFDENYKLNSEGEILDSLIDTLNI